MRCFIGIDIPDEVKAKILSIEQQLAMSGITLVKSNALHITMLFLGEISSERIKAIEEALASIKHEKFDVSAYGVGYFTPKDVRVVYVKIGAGSEELTSIHDEIYNTLSKLVTGLKREDDFVPHITLARTKPFIERKELLARLGKIENTDFGSFTVDGISFKSSKLTPQGPYYKELYRVNF